MSGAELRLGRWEDVLADVECDALICDPPYSARVHSAWSANALAGKDGVRVAVSYMHWGRGDVHRFVADWSPMVRGWMVCLTSHDLVPAWEQAFKAAGRCYFAPLPCVTIGGSIRMAGDGPSNWTVYAMVARPRTREMQAWGTLRGAYIESRSWTMGGGGRGKALGLMRALVADYSRPGDLVVDPCAGWASTGVAALTMGRRFLGSECDPETHAKGAKRLAETQVVDLFDGGRAVQPGLFEETR